MDGLVAGLIDVSPQPLWTAAARDEAALHAVIADVVHAADAYPRGHVR